MIYEIINNSINLKGSSIRLFQDRDPKTGKKFETEEEVFAWLEEYVSNLGNKVNITFSWAEDDEKVLILNKDYEEDSLLFIRVYNSSNEIEKSYEVYLSDSNVTVEFKDLQNGEYFFDIEVNEGYVLLNKNETFFKIESE